MSGTLGCLITVLGIAVVVAYTFSFMDLEPIGDSDPDIVDYLSGQNDVGRGYYGGTITFYAEAIRMDPTNADAHYGHGVAHHRYGNHDDAIADFVKAIDLNSVLARRPYHTEAYLSRGHAHQKNGDVEAAKADFAKAKKLLKKVAGEEMEVQALRVRVLQAIEQIGDVGGENESMSSTLFVLLMWCGIPLSLTGVAVLSFVLFHRREKESGESTQANLYYNQGYTYQMNGEHDRAIVSYSQAIKLDPAHAQAYNNRGIAFQTIGDEGKAAADFAKAKELGYDGS
jgi:tetratricopeptide (TPR) repeat protein